MEAAKQHARTFLVEHCEFDRTLLISKDKTIFCKVIRSQARLRFDLLIADATKFSWDFVAKPSALRRDLFSALHWIIRCPSMLCGPCAFAVLRSMTSSNLVSRGSGSAARTFGKTSLGRGTPMVSSVQQAQRVSNAVLTTRSTKVAFYRPAQSVLVGLKAALSLRCRGTGKGRLC